MSNSYHHIGLRNGFNETIKRVFLDYNQKQKLRILTRDDCFYSYAVADLDDHAQLWYELYPGAPTCIARPHYCDVGSSNVKFSHWIWQSEDQLSGMVRVENPHDGLEIPLNLIVPNAAMAVDLTKGENFPCQIAAFPITMDVYQDIHTFKTACPSIAVEHMIPNGTFPLDNDPSFVETAHILFSGIVRKATVRRNWHTKIQYQYVLVESLGLLFHVVSDLRDVKHPIRPGNIVNGQFTLSGMFEHDAILVDMTEEQLASMQMDSVTEEMLRQAHEYAHNNMEALKSDTVCGCFSCCKIFHPSEIREYLIEDNPCDGKGTAICPYCEIDSVIDESSGFPIIQWFLRKMEQYWFNEL